MDIKFEHFVRTLHLGNRGMGGMSVGGRPISAGPQTHSLRAPPANNSARPISANLSFRDRLQAAKEMYDTGAHTDNTSTTSHAKQTPGGRFKPETKPTPPLPGDSPVELKKLVQDALHHFDIYHIAEAEVMFQRALCAMENKIFPGREHLIVQCLGGLAMLFFKRSRSCRHDEMEWHRMMVHSVVLQTELVRYCQELADNREGIIQNERELKKWAWLEMDKKKAEQQQRILDKLLIESLQQRVAVVEMRVPTDKIAHAPVFLDIGWLERFNEHVRQKTEKMYENGLASPRNLVAEDLESVVMAELSPTTPVSQPGCRIKKLDCDRVQRTIMKLVRQISSDMRQRYIRKKLSEKMFRETVSSEMIAKCATMAETKDILELFENAIIQYKYGVSAEEFRTWNVESNEIDSDSTGNETTSTDTNSDDQSPAHLPYLPSLYENDSPESPMEVNSYNFPGVLTVWRAYGKHHHAHVRSCLPPFRPYLLQGFEEFSPLTETRLLSSVHTTASQVSTPSRSSTTATSSSSSSVPSPIDIRPPNYITESRFQYALAITLVKCAQHLQKDPQALNQACELFKYALGILQSLPTDIAGLQELIALVLKNVGIIRCTQGNITVGSQLMHEAMELFSPDNDVENVNVAEVWFELGEAYMQQQWKEDSIFEHVMRLVRDELSREFRPDEDEDVPDDASVDSDTSDCGASYSVCAQEAMGCYKSALAILSRLRRKKEIHTSLYVDVLTKLGDCAIIVGEYERAVLCYEEALYLCQNTLGSVSLINSAHILSMLGTTNFLLGTYSKAATMYETASILQQHLYGFEDNFEMAFTMSMLGNTYYVMKRYHKCVAWCMKAFEIYVNIYKQEIIFVDSLHRWFIAHTLYCLGFAYGHLNFHDKALHNLDLAKNMIEKATDGDVDIHQHVRILKVMADVNANMDQNQLALGYYQEALDLSMALGDETSITTLQNQLLNRMAGIHVNTKQYDTAAEYLEQALDCQRNVETSIKGDLIGIMYQLGNTYILSGDMDRAIECFNECHEAYQEAHVSSGPDIAGTLCHLGTLYHLKGCMQDDNDDMLEYLESADQYYKDAVEMEPLAYICVQYANFLHQQEQYADALQAILPIVFLNRSGDDQDVHYNGPEQAILPEHLLFDLNDTDEVVLDARVFARFLGILCLKQLGLYSDAVDCMVSMVEIVNESLVALNHSLLGYVFIEMGMYEEAAESFHRAAAMQHDNDVSIMNQWICLCLSAYMVLVRAEYHIWAVSTEAYIDLTGPAPTPTTTLPVYRKPSQPSDIPRPLRDSGYYDHAEETAMDLSRIRSFLESLDVGYKSTEHLPDVISPISPDITTANENVFHDDSCEQWHVEEEQVVETPQHVLDAIFSSQTSNSDNINFPETTQDQYFSEVAPATNEPENDQWIIEEEITLETPSAIIAALSGKLTMEEKPSPHDYQTYEYDGDLRHKTAHAYSSTYDVNDYHSSYKSSIPEEWSKKNRSTAPPDLLEGLHNNYNYPITDHRNVETNSFTRTSHPADTNGNGAFSTSSISTRQQSRSMYPSTWQSHYDGLNGNSNTTTTTTTGYSELNANTANDDQEEEPVWETWETSEETVVETPAVILQAILASQNKA